MRCVPRVAAFAWLAAVAASGAQESVLTHHTLATGLVPGDARFDMLLPPAYEPDRPEPYPLLLWLHGGTSGESQLERRLRAPLERAWEAGTIEPLVVVAPITGYSYWIDWKGGGNDWETLLLGELLAHVRSAWHVAQGRAGTLIGGASAGGQGTLLPARDASRGTRPRGRAPPGRREALGPVRTARAQPAPFRHGGLRRRGRRCRRGPLRNAPASWRPSVPSTPNLRVSGSRKVPRERRRSGAYVKRTQYGGGPSGCHPEGTPLAAHSLCCRLSTYGPIRLRVGRLAPGRPATR